MQAIAIHQEIKGALDNAPLLYANEVANHFKKAFEFSGVSKFPFKFKKGVINLYKSKLKNSEKAANDEFRAVKSMAENLDFSLAENDAKLKKVAAYHATQCEEIYRNQIDKTQGDLEKVFQVLSDYCKSEAIEPAEVKKGVYGACQRMKCEQWWRRRLRVLHAQGLEKLALKLGETGVSKGLYLSDPSHKRRVKQRGANARILESVKAVNEVGDEFSLSELVEKSVSNPVIRRAELMTRISGFEAYADRKNHVAEFYTITCPSRMHSARKLKNKTTGRYFSKPNSKYDGTTPKEAQAYLAGVWAKVRASLKRSNIDLYGFRVVEPHHDSTPHWHLLIFLPEEQREKCRDVFWGYFLQEDGYELTTRKKIVARFKAIEIERGLYQDIDKKTGEVIFRKRSAAGYIAKYIAKAIDGFGVNECLNGGDAKESASRIEAWASTWKIRQFQQIGGHSVSLWRELRRLKDSEIDSAHLAVLRDAACNSDWSLYLSLMDGAQAELLKVGFEDGEVNKYGDSKAEVIKGVKFGKFEYVSRPHEWKLELGTPEGEDMQTNVNYQNVLSAEAIEAELYSAAAWPQESEAARTRINNCTRHLTESDLEQALTVFEYEKTHETEVKRQIEFGLKDGFHIETVERQVKRQFMNERFNNERTLCPNFMERLHKIWRIYYSDKDLLNEFGGILYAEDRILFEEFKEEHFADFAASHIWHRYGVVIL